MVPCTCLLLPQQPLLALLSLSFAHAARHADFWRCPRQPALAAGHLNAAPTARHRNLRALRPRIEQMDIAWQHRCGDAAAADGSCAVVPGCGDEESALRAQLRKACWLRRRPDGKQLDVVPSRRGQQHLVHDQRQACVLRTTTCAIGARTQTRTGKDRQTTGCLSSTT